MAVESSSRHKVIPSGVFAGDSPIHILSQEKTANIREQGLLTPHQQAFVTEQMRLLQQHMPQLSQFLVQAHAITSARRPSDAQTIIAVDMGLFGFGKSDEQIQNERMLEVLTPREQRDQQDSNAEKLGTAQERLWKQIEDLEAMGVGLDEAMRSVCGRYGLRREMLYEKFEDHHERGYRRGDNDDTYSGLTDEQIARLKDPNFGHGKIYPPQKSETERRRETRIVLNTFFEPERSDSKLTRPTYEKLWDFINDGDKTAAKRFLNSKFERDDPNSEIDNKTYDTLWDQIDSM